MIIKHDLSITCVDFFVHMLLSSCLGKYSPWANGFPSYNKIPISHIPYALCHISLLSKSFLWPPLISKRRVIGKCLQLCHNVQHCSTCEYSGLLCVFISVHSHTCVYAHVQTHTNAHTNCNRQVHTRLTTYTDTQSLTFPHDTTDTTQPHHYIII